MQGAGVGQDPARERSPMTLHQWAGCALVILAGASVYVIWLVRQYEKAVDEQQRKTEQVRP